MWLVLSEQQILCAPLGSEVRRFLQECAERFWPQGALAQVHVSVTLHFILYTGKLKLDVAWLVCLLLCSTNLDVKRGINSTATTEMK